VSLPTNYTSGVGVGATAYLASSAVGAALTKVSWLFIVCGFCCWRGFILLVSSTTVAECQIVCSSASSASH